jgi:UDP-N-acetylmuramoyl-L-alanyl-D-glutamate--2,6-diaminopimelate ligase
MRLSELLAEFPDLRAQLRQADPDITEVVADSRRVRPGALFVAVRGEAFDGHRFIPQALERGAAAIVAEEAAAAGGGGAARLRAPNTRDLLGPLAAAAHGFPARRLTLIGVTGTDGKTTTASLIHSILLAAGLKAGLISTVNAVIGDETLDTGFHVTTPEAVEVQSYLARMAAAGLTHCVLEVTSHGLAQGRVNGCDFDVAVVTNITHEHLDFHKTYENYRAAKGQLFSGLSTAYKKPGVPKAGVLNADDGSFGYLSGVLKETRYAYSLSTRTDLVARHIRYAPETTRFHTSISDLEFSTSLVGAYNVSNCLAAIAATVLALGLPPEAAQAGLAALQGVPGRMERINLGQPFTAIVDFAHTPNALRRAIETARGMIRTAKDAASAKADEANNFASPARSAVQSASRVITVFGSAGLRDVEKRRLMAETSAELADLTILTAEDPRTESLDDILEMMAFGARRQGGVEGQTFFRAPDRGDALRLAVRLAQPGDVVLACGKGHEQSMCFGAVEYPWDDRIALRAALAELLSVNGPEMPRLPTSEG